jgi:lysophospholipase L1-like esterase
LGDSITAGSYGDGKNGDGGYRRQLWQFCQAAKLPVEFVGTLNDPRNATFDADHEGHRGCQIEDLTRDITKWLARCRPDVIFLQIGVNDFIHGATPELAAQRLDVLLDRCHYADPEAVLYVAAILSVRTPNDYHVQPAMLSEYNSLMPAVVTRHGSNCCFVDLPRLCNFTQADFGVDGLHPSAAGYAKMAKAWFDILQKRVSASPTSPHRARRSNGLLIGYIPHPLAGEGVQLYLPT